MKRILGIVAAVALIVSQTVFSHGNPQQVVLDGKLDELQKQIDDLKAGGGSGGSSTIVLDNKQEKGSGSTKADADMEIGPYSTDAVVIMNAWGRSVYRGKDGKNAGILVQLTVDGAVLAQDDSFEGSSHTISFFAAASHTHVLKAGNTIKVEATVTPRGKAGGLRNRESDIHLNTVVVGG